MCKQTKNVAHKDILHNDIKCNSQQQKFKLSIKYKTPNPDDVFIHYITVNALCLCTVLLVGTWRGGGYHHLLL